MRLTDTDVTDDADTGTVIVSLMQKYRRQMKTELQSTENVEEAIGFDILKVPPCLASSLDCTRKQCARNLKWEFL